MTSGTFRSVFIDQIIIDRSVRQRRELEKLDELAESIKNVGLINAPVVTPDFILIAGERRLEACRSLGWTEIPVQFTTDLDPVELHLIELEENVKRVDLSWQDQNDAVARYHELRAAADPSWNQAKTAAALGVNDSTVSKHLAVAEVRKSKAVPDIESAEKLSTAINIATRRKEREKDKAVRALFAADSRDLEQPERYASILNASFHDWAKQEQEHKFNFLHCDFPYGVNTGDKKGQSAAKALGTYDDSAETYFALIDTLNEKKANFLAPQAHMIFWFSMKFYSETKQLLEAGGWRVDPFPLIWHKSDSKGIIPDPNRGGRRTYETAFFCSFGDRKIVRSIDISMAAPTTKQFHTSEKPSAMLQHFFRMVLDDTTRMLDPTCGSGMAIKVAEEMGAAYSLGLEINPDFAESAKRNVGL
jgi:ParB/RepB/Spo0J family partition protein